MGVEILTKEDFYQFKTELLAEIQKVLNEKVAMNKKWLRSKEVEKILNISSGTLLNYRVQGKIKFTKVGDTYFYPLEDLFKQLETSAAKQHS